MQTCEFCSDNLLDFVYGLLEETDHQETQAHLETCADCQTALTNIKTSQKLIARAAKAISQVPEFALPSDPATLPIDPTALSLTVEIAPQRKRSGRPWLAWATAAAVLLAVTLPIVWYRNKIHALNTEVASARIAYKNVERELSILPAKYEPLHKAAIQDLRAKAKLHLHVVGPKTLEPNAKAHLDITTRHPEGELAACDLRVKLLEVGTKNVVKIARLHSDGQTRVEIDAASARPNAALNLLVEAETPFGLTHLDEVLNVQAPSYVTRIDTNKLLYQSREVLFFRVLVLDRGTLQPPTQPIALRVALMHDKKTLRTLELATGAGGILAAEFAVEEAYPEGSYSLEVSPVDARKANVQAAVQSLEIVRALPGIRLDQNRYARGTSVTGNLRLSGNQPVPNSVVGKLDGKAIPITLQPQAAPAVNGFGAGGGGGFAASGAGGGAKSAAKDALAADRFYRFATPPIPANFAPGAQQLRLTVPLFDSAAKKQELGTYVPLEPTDFAIDFFPEGGDLVAGVQNRVFYRVRSKSGSPVTSEGQVILLTSKNDVVDSSYQFGMGYFDFTPSLKETYTVRITTPAKIETVAAPFAKLGVRSSGVVMEVADPCDDYAPKAVGAQGDPIRVTLRRQGPPCKLLMVAHCRGQIVDQRWVELRKEPVDVSLQPTPEAHGMIRVTAYEMSDAALEPIAERLVYRTPAQRLDLAVTPDREHYLSGQKATARIGARDETGQAADAWILASVVDERFQSRPRSLSAHFLLLNELRSGPDIDNAQIILHDSPDAAPLLERFLGTYGWRRYVSAPAVALAAPNPAPALVFSKENRPLETLQQRYQDKIGAALTPLRIAATQEQQHLSCELERLAQEANVLTGRLYAFEMQTQLWIRLGLGGAVALLLLVGVVLMGVGIVHSLRNRQSPTPAFGSAFACLAACLAVYFVGSLLGPLQESEPGRALAERADAMVPNGLDKQLAEAPRVRFVPQGLPTGDFKLRAHAQNADRQARAADVESRRREQAKTALQNELLTNLARDRAETATYANRRNLAAETESSPWFQYARGVSGPAAKMKGKPKLMTPVAPETKADKKPARQLEYPYQPGPNALGDTLLWHPALTLVNGNAEVRFDITPGPATYRVLLLGNGPTGRFGFFETRFDVP